MGSKRKRLLEEIKGMFERDSKREIFKKYIEYIRFPYFKNFEEDLKVNFTFPITFIVGQNGSGKSSLLHALYGAPRGKSISDFWYTTAMDPIEDLKKRRNCFIYSYKTPYTKTQVEILKQRSGTKKGKDYWEPAEPKLEYKMSKLPKDADDRESSKDRWNVIEKKVYIMDFRYSLSAYDKYFYFGTQPSTKTLKTKQDIIRKYAHKLKSAFDNNKEEIFRSRKVKKPIILSEEEVKIIKKILGKDYVRTQFTEHNMYDKKMGFAIRFETNNTKYSEAYAGSGETAIVKLVHDLFNVEEYSLILLDEPETSLHPLAQKELVNFILEQIKRKKLQVVISTHSPDIIEGMPPEAVKIFYVNQDTGKTSVIENVFPENAFVHIGRSVTDKKVIIAEDILAKMIVEKIIERNGDRELFEVKFFPGGVSQIKQNEMTVYSKEKNSGHFIIFDGDQRKEKVDITKLTDVDKRPENLKRIIKELVGRKIKFSFDSNASDEQKINLMLKYIKYHHDNVFFLPKNTPEEIIWDEDILDKADLSDEKKEKIKNESDCKKKFNLFALYNFGGDTSEYQIKAYEYFLIRWLEKENEDYRNISDIINEIKKKYE